MISPHLYKGTRHFSVMTAFPAMESNKAFIIILSRVGTEVKAEGANQLIYNSDVCSSFLAFVCLYVFTSV